MTIAQEILEAWDPDYSVSVPEMARTRGGYRTGNRFVFPDGSRLVVNVALGMEPVVAIE